MVSALDSGLSSLGSSPGRGHCVVFLGKVYKWTLANLKLKVTLQWTSIPSRGSRITYLIYDNHF